MSRWLLITAVYVYACTPANPKTELPKSFHIVVPDSLNEFKQRFLESAARWRDRNEWPYRFSDSAEFKIYINDLSVYQASSVRLTKDSIHIQNESLIREPYTLIHKLPGSIRILTARVRPWTILDAIRQMIENDTGSDEIVMVRSREQIVFAEHRNGNIWTNDVNLFEERRHYEQAASITGDGIQFHGQSIPYDPHRVKEIITKYPGVSVPSVFVYADYETKAKMTGNIMEYSYDFEKNRIHVVNSKLVKNRFPELLSIFLAYQTYGNRYPWLIEGLGVFHAQTFFGKPLSWWQERESLLNLITPSKLLREKSPDQNPFLYTYLSELFWEKFSMQAKNVFLDPEKFFKNFNPSFPEVNTHFPAKPDVPFFKGLCYAHTNGVESGYMSQRSRQSLEEIKSLGANTVSITPFGYSHTETSPEVFFVLDNNWDETLGSLYKATEDAHEIGLSVMMKPHIWLGNGVWCGKIKVEGDDNLKIWENTFTQFVVYHALIAELTGMESLCMCVELPNMSTHTAMWLRIIRYARTAYKGYLTYGGNWFDEYDKIQFWDQLDFIGVQHYFPLADGQSYSQEDIEKRLNVLSEQFDALSKKWNRKIVLTEVGFPSIEYALLSPHEEIFSQTASEDVQALGYDQTMKEFMQQSWAGGLFWWKWESGRSPRTGDKSFQLKGKKAETVLKKYYQAP
ncbi:hypothetical protein K1X84_02270 [bacterium]|nr:hypothetical protein [bacterium]